MGLRVGTKEKVHEIDRDRDRDIRDKNREVWRWIEFKAEAVKG